MMLDKDEFHKFAMKFVAQGDRWGGLCPGFFQRISMDGAMNSTVWPVAAPIAKKLTGLEVIPDAVAASLISTVGKIGKAINPFTLK
eukprot:scaffold186318_cov28-Prasinocladus_malaysianus.AAC.1